jgi:hypothetical protein
VDHTLRLIQHNWIVLAYNFDLVILVLIIGESSIGVLSFYYSFIIVITLHYHLSSVAEEHEENLRLVLQKLREHRLLS